MEKLVALCKRRGFIFQSSEIYGGLNGFWDYGPLGVELKRNVKEAWWREMVTLHDEFALPPGAPATYSMVGLDCSIIMHPQIWKCSGHFDLFNDFMVDCIKCKSRFRADHLRVKYGYAVVDGDSGRSHKPVACKTHMPGDEEARWSVGKQNALEKQTGKEGQASGLTVDCPIEPPDLNLTDFLSLLKKNNVELPISCPKMGCDGTLTAPREFNLMFKTIVGAMGTAEDAAFLRPETAQGIFANFKNVCDTQRVKVPFGICQVGKSFRNEITPRNFTFRSREFEQMELEFFCHPGQSLEWYKYWRDRRYQWYLNLGLSREKLQLRDHAKDELSHYSCGTADIEYAFPFLEAGEFGELEGVAHRGDFDLRSHKEGKLAKDANGELQVELNAEGKPRHPGSGKDLSYFDDQTRERYLPHVIEPSAGADRATLAFLCEAYHEDAQPDEKGVMQERVVLKLHPRLAPVKAAIFPLVKKEGMPEFGLELYRELKRAGIATVFDQQAAIGKRYRRQDEIGTPFCITVDGQTMTDKTVTLRDRDTLEQRRIPADKVLAEIQARLA